MKPHFIRRLHKLMGVVVGLCLIFGPSVEGESKSFKGQRESGAIMEANVDLSGTWLFDDATYQQNLQLSAVWRSLLKIEGHSFSMSRLLDRSQEMKGSFKLNPSVDPMQIDLQMEALDLSGFGQSLKIPACTLPGIFKIEGDQLSVCLAAEEGGERPRTFKPGKSVIQMRLVRAPKGFTDFPREVAFKVFQPDGQPSANAKVFGMMMHDVHPDPNIKMAEWGYHDEVPLKEAGIATFRYEQLRSKSVIARDEERKLIGIALVSPVKVVRDEIQIVMQPECRVAGSIRCKELTSRGQPLGWTNVMVMHHGRRIASYASYEGHYAFFLPPGDYTMELYGNNVKSEKRPLLVPKNRAELSIEPVELKAHQWLLLMGQPAPELDEIVGWKGAKVSLAELKGKYVLLEFWGYWCGPCVAGMPILIELHERYADKGLVIIGIHMDHEGEVDTVAKLDEKIAHFRKGIWKGKELPFPVAMISGKKAKDENAPGGPVHRYGVRAFPTTLLIDREGKLVRNLHFKNLNEAIETVEALLKEGK